MAHRASSAHGRSKRWFPAKRDAWLVALLWAAEGMMLWSIRTILGNPDSAPWLKVLSVAWIAAVSVLVFWLLYGTRYGILGGVLVVRCGPFRWRIPLSGVDSVRPTRNPLSSPAPSLDRLAVRYDGGRRTILISPEDKGGFLRALVTRAPHLELVGQRAERRMP